MAPPAPLAPRPASSVDSSARALRGLPAFGYALVAPYRGCGTLLVRPRLWPLALVPCGAFAVVAAVGAHVARGLYHHASLALTNALGSSWIGAAGAFVARIVVAFGLLVAVLAIASMLVPALSAPFMDRLAGHLDRDAGVKQPLLTQLARSLRVAVAGLTFVALPQLALWALSLALPALAPVWLVASASVSSFGLAYDALDWPLARRGLGVRARLRWMREHFALTAGLGAGTWTLALVPGLAILLLPAIVAGGVAAVRATEPQERSNARAT